MTPEEERNELARIAAAIGLSTSQTTVFPTYHDLIVYCRNVPNDRFCAYFSAQQTAESNDPRLWIARQIRGTSSGLPLSEKEARDYCDAHGNEAFLPVAGYCRQLSFTATSRDPANTLAPPPTNELPPPGQMFPAPDTLVVRPPQPAPAPTPAPSPAPAPVPSEASNKFGVFVEGDAPVLGLAFAVLAAGTAAFVYVASRSRASAR